MNQVTYEDLAQELLTRYPGRVDPLRLNKALSLVQNRTMIYNNFCAAGEYDVRSESGRAWYHVNLPAHTCTCPDSNLGHVCKHRLAAWLYTEQISRTEEAARQDGIRLAQEEFEEARRLAQAKAEALANAEAQASEAREARIQKYIHELGF